MDNVTIRFIKEVITVKYGYTDSELNLLLKKPNLKKCEFCEYRNWVITNYLLGTGNRLNTVINIRIEDVIERFHSY